MNIDPVALKIGLLEIRWYSLAYIIGILFAYWYVQKIDKYKVFTPESYKSIISWWVTGMILGGRIGYILFYNLNFYMSFPIEMFKLWKGGMSFHGASLGLFCTMYIFCKKYKIKFLSAIDLCLCAVPVGIFLGRIANFINGELYGKVTNTRFGMIFQNSGDFFYRHPSQLYEAFFEGLLLFVVMNLLFFFTKVKSYQGMLFTIFMIWYGIVRFFIEFVREPDVQVGYILFNWITMGQLLSFIMVILGICILRLSRMSHNI
ncbi:Prolipoprotein diacylglyceryl transferase [Ehrlichia ruminantium str. Gardel]|uniref:Phosphatidylglycerol--prolipoprotein diacylglyceryl transferase n=1 Tax=Ehrlichia ruminantium (strain Gardel) TaxID=302409 RepID=LGT_EHRRG|nr:prolipoprotein diacylglyceryl transferase [Ehrlichia ruminantium]Q5FGK0.1 RecName: Full=Phosphatidylglycerol--prolipoprotein diacylglyceryl transferase [Ehrlichia ruminantium str. Gardel]CAI28338.1 Prolipoprotein diacylglyceryl transferase [Ehrlichia ruminantium str. Gardel]